MRESTEVCKTLAPSLFLSMPQLNDPNFKRTVILVCEHGAGGAFGLILNRQTETRVTVAMQHGSLALGDDGLQLWFGGPVAPESVWILTGEEPRNFSSVKVYEGVYLSTSPQLLRKLLAGPIPPRTRVLAGYTGWGSGQLDTELEASSWLTTDVHLDIIFNTRSTEMWEKAIRRLGSEPSILQMGAGVH